MVRTVSIVWQLADGHGLSDARQRSDVTESHVRILEIVEENKVDVGHRVVVKSAHFPLSSASLTVETQMRIRGAEVKTVARGSDWRGKTHFGRRSWRWLEIRRMRRRREREMV